MSELKVRLYQASFNPSHPCRRGPNIENFLKRNSTNNASWERDNENNFAKLYFCLTPQLKDYFFTIKRSSIGLISFSLASSRTSPKGICAINFQVLGISNSLAVASSTIGL